MLGNTAQYVVTAGAAFPACFGISSGLPGPQACGKTKDRRQEEHYTWDVAIAQLWYYLHQFSSLLKLAEQRQASNTCVRLPDYEMLSDVCCVLCTNRYKTHATATFKSVTNVTANSSVAVVSSGNRFDS